MTLPLHIRPAVPADAPGGGGQPLLPGLCLCLVDEADELAELKARAQGADMALLDEGATTCCYARSDKHWITDPQGVAWEHFHTLGNIPVFNEAAAQQPAKTTQQPAQAACCPTGAPSAPAPGQAACCGPTANNTNKCC